MDSKRRFSDRVASYVRYRPGYPAAAIDFICTALGVTAASVVADIGSGTGILSRLLLPRVAKLYGIEPNAEMRRAAEDSLSHHANFVSINATAERTGLPSDSVDFIFAAQAFHWFDRKAAKIEFHRILRTEGMVILLWNNRLLDTEFLRGYESILQEYANDYREVHHLNPQEAELAEFLDGIRKSSFPNRQSFDFEELLGRVSSASYSPLPGQPRYAGMYHALEELFHQCSVNGRVEFNYETNVFWGNCKEDLPPLLTSHPSPRE